MCKVEFLPYARFLAPSVKRMFRLRVCVTVHMCACTYWCVCSHIHVCTCAYMYLSVKFSDALLHPYKSVCLSVRLLVRPSVRLSLCMWRFHPNQVLKYSSTVDINDGIMREQGRIHGHKLLLEGRNAKASRTDGPKNRSTDGHTLL